MTTRQSKLRTTTITPNANKSFPIGTMLMVDYFYNRLDLTSIIGPMKSKGLDSTP